MKWEEIKEQFFQAASRLNQDITYITKVGEAFEELVKALYVRDPNTCVDEINKNAEIIAKIFTVEDPQSIPPEALEISSQALVGTQQFLFTFLRVASLFNAMNPPTEQDIQVPPGTHFH